MRTYQSRIAASPELEGALDAYGELFGRCVRTLHALRRAGRVPTKPEFMARFELTARQYNAVKNTLDGIEASYRRRLPELIAEDRQRLASIRRRLKPTSSKNEAEPRLTPFVRHNLQRREARIKDRIARREREHEDGSVRIAFGSRRLFRAQDAARCQLLRLSRGMALCLAERAIRLVLRLGLQRRDRGLPRLRPHAPRG
jgi:hypothetical protein